MKAKKGFTNYLKYSFNRLLKISLRLRNQIRFFGQNRILISGIIYIPGEGGHEEGEEEITGTATQNQTEPGARETCKLSFSLFLCPNFYLSNFIFLLN